MKRYAEMNELESKLDTVGKAVLSFIRSNRKDFDQFTEVVAAQDGLESIVYLRIEAPNPKIEFPLFVTTEGGELTWGFAGWHGHFAGDTPAEIQRVFADVEAVRRDEVLSVCFERDGKWAGGALVKAGSPIFAGHFESFAGSAQIRSWTGALDQDISNA